MVEETKSAEQTAANQSVNASANASQTANTQAPASQAPVQAPLGDEQKMVDLRALQESREQIKSLRAELDMMRTVPQYPQQQQQYQYQAPPQENVSQQLEALWDEDPRKAMQAEVMMALNWYDASNASVDKQEEVLASKYTDFNNYRGKIRSYLRSIPVAERVKPGMVESAYYFVKGQSTDDILKQREEELLKKYHAGGMAGGLTYGTTSSSTSNTDPQQATMAQKVQADKMGMSIEDYMKNIK